MLKVEDVIKKLELIETVKDGLQELIDKQTTPEFYNALDSAQELLDEFADSLRGLKVQV